MAPPREISLNIHNSVICGQRDCSLGLRLLPDIRRRGGGIPRWQRRRNEPNDLMQIRYAWKTENVLSGQTSVLSVNGPANSTSVLVLFLLVSALH